MSYGNEPTQQWQPAPPQKKRRPALWIVLAAVAAVLLVCGIGTAVGLGSANDAIKQAEPKITHAPTSAKTPTAQPAEQTADAAANDAPANASIGGTLTIEGDDLEVDYTLTKVEQKTADRYGLKPDHGVYLLVHLSVKVVKGEQFICSCELAFITKSGKVFEETYADFKSRPDFESADVKTGQNLDGWVVFDVPKPVAGGKVQLTSENLFTDNAYGYWQL